MIGTTKALIAAFIVLKVSCATACSQTVMKSTALIKNDNIAVSMVLLNWIEGSGDRRQQSPKAARKRRGPAGLEDERYSMDIRVMKRSEFVHRFSSDGVQQSSAVPSRRRSDDQ